MRILTSFDRCKQITLGNGDLQIEQTFRVYCVNYHQIISVS
jgi:hypothetical protein